MSLPNDTEIARQGGRFNAALGMLLTTLDVERMGEMGIQTVLHYLMLLHYDDREGVPVSGFPRSRIGDNNCQATSTGDLTFDVEPGWGIVYNASQIGADEFGSPAYQMVANGGSFSGSLAAHDPTNPRIDLIALAPIRALDQAATRNIKDPSTGVLSTSSVDQRSRFGAQLVTITGTPPPPPPPPPLPDGHLLVAYADVPATAGAAVLRDARQILHVGNWIKGGPNSSYSVDHVHPPGFPNELEAEETSPASLGVLVNRGRANIEGTIRFYAEETLAIAAADPVNPRIDLISAKRDGTLEVTTGTPAATPATPAGPADSIPLAEVAVAALAATILAADITDLRDRSWLNGGLAVQDGTLPWTALDPAPVSVGLVSATIPTSDTRRFDLALVDPNGEPIPAGTYPVDVLVETYWADPSFVIFAGGTYDNSNGATRFMDGDHMLLASGVDIVTFPDGTLENESGTQAGQGPTVGSSTGRFYGRVTATGWAVELCRNTTTTPSADLYLVVTPMVGGGPIGPGYVALVSFP